MATSEQHLAAVKLFSGLGKHRLRLQEESDKLAEEIRQALASTEGEISKVEVASLLGMDRAGLYRTYLKETR